MKKPEQVSWLQFYILWPIQDVWDNIEELFGALRIRFIGGWYCEHCKEIHNRRTYKYKLFFVKDTAKVLDKGTLYGDVSYLERCVCSLGRDALRSGSWVYEGRCLKAREDTDEQQD